MVISCSSSNSSSSSSSSSSSTVEPRYKEVGYNKTLL